MTTLQNGSSARDAVVEDVEDLLGRDETFVLAPQPLGVRREPFVQPDVPPLRDAPGCRRTTGARARARRRDVGRERVGEEALRVDRPGLGLQREAERRRGRRRCRPRPRTDSGRRVLDRKSMISPLPGERAVDHRRRAAAVRPRPCRRSSRSRWARCRRARRAPSSRRTCRRRPRTTSCPRPSRRRCRRRTRRGTGRRRRSRSVIETSTVAAGVRGEVDLHCS